MKTFCLYAMTMLAMIGTFIITFLPLCLFTNWDLIAITMCSFIASATLVLLLFTELDEGYEEEQYQDHWDAGHASEAQSRVGGGTILPRRRSGTEE